MRIGELARLTAVSTRSLRYYEEQCLLQPDRHGNGYREYPESAVETVGQIRALIDAGFTTETIRRVLPCMEGTAVDLCPQVAALVKSTLDGIESQMRDLEAKRIRVETLLSGRQVS